jgi:tetratricopeptide (TPR) repeat protein
MSMFRNASNGLCLLFSLFFCVLCGGLNASGQNREFAEGGAAAHSEQDRKRPNSLESGSDRNNDAQAILRDARAALKKGDEKRALDLLAKLGPDDGAGHFAAGALLVEEKSYAAAAREFGLARRIYKDPYIAGYDQSLAYLNAGDYAAAIQTANELLNQGYRTAELANVAATAYLKSGQTKEAYNALRIATELNPKDEDSYVDLDSICLDNDNYDLGLEIANIGLSHLPKSSRLYLQRGVMRAMKGQFADAEQDFITAARLAPQEVMPSVALALVSMQSNNLDHAVAILREAATRHPDDYFAQYWFAEALLHAGAVPGTKAGAEALAALQASVRSKPDFWHSRADLGKVLLERGQVDPAIVQLEKAADLNPSASGPLYLLAQAYRRRGNLERAQEIAARVGKMQADDREGRPQAMLKRLVREGSPSSPSDQKEQ